MEEPKEKPQKEMHSPMPDRMHHYFRGGPNSNPGGTIDTDDALIPPCEKRTGGETRANDQDTPEGQRVTSKTEKLR